MPSLTLTSLIAQADPDPALAVSALNWYLIYVLLGVVVVTSVALLITLRRARKRREALRSKPPTSDEPGAWNIAGERAQAPTPEELESDHQHDQ